MCHVTVTICFYVIIIIPYAIHFQNMWFILSVRLELSAVTDYL